MTGILVKQNRTTANEWQNDGINVADLKISKSQFKKTSIMYPKRKNSLGAIYKGTLSSIDVTVREIEFERMSTIVAESSSIFYSSNCQVDSVENPNQKIVETSSEYSSSASMNSVDESKLKTLEKTLIFS